MQPRRLANTLYKESDTSNLIRTFQPSQQVSDKFRQPQNTLGCFKKYTKMKGYPLMTQLALDYGLSDPLPTCPVNKIRLQNIGNINPF